MNKLIVSLLLTLGITSVAHAAGDATAGQAKAAVCGACHGPDGNSPAPNFPKLAGQGERYLTKQMHDIKDGKRTVLEMTGLLTNLSDQDLADIAAEISTPLLRKDFVVDDYQLYEARLLGASAVLLISEITEEATLGRRIALARRLGLSALVEAHTEPEIAKALRAQKADASGVGARVASMANARE